MMDEKKFEGWLYVIGIAVTLIIFYSMLPKWEKGDEEIAVLKAAGYSDIKLTGFSNFDCPDIFGMGFEAKGPTGVKTKGAVCRGILTGASIRIKG